MSDSKQILIDGDLHRRLKAHVANLGVSTMKSYVETVLEHAMLTNGLPLQIIQPSVATQEPDPEPEPTAEPTAEIDLPPVLPTIEAPSPENLRSPWGGAISGPPKKGSTNDW